MLFPEYSGPQCGACQVTTDTTCFLPYGHQVIDEDDIAAVVDVLRGDWMTGGPAVAGFEQALATQVSAAHATVCSNGTTALHIAYGALGLVPGECVVVPAVTFLATANAADYLGAEVVFADVDPDSGLMMPHHAEQAVLAAQRQGKRVRALVPVHLNGQTGDPAGMAALASACGASVVEDACHALGSQYRDDQGTVHTVGACAHADLSCFSFHPVKNISMGEGGAITSQSASTDARMKILRNHGMTRDPALFQSPELAFDHQGNANPWYYEMVAQGYNFRATDMQCALGRSQLRKLPAFIQRRQHLVELYARLLSDIPGVMPVGRVASSQPAWHLAVALIDFAGLGRDRATVMRALSAAGIGSQVHYLPVPWQPYWKNRAIAGPSLSGAARYYERCLSLPLYPTLQDTDVQRVAETLRAVLA